MTLSGEQARELLILNTLEYGKKSVGYNAGANSEIRRTSSLTSSCRQNKEN